MKVYIVFSDDDYFPYVMGVYLDKQKALDYRDQLNREGEADGEIAASVQMVEVTE